MRRPRRAELRAEDYVAGVLAGDRAVLGRAVTLMESEHPAHARMAQEVLTALLPHTGHARRIGVSGVPGAGKSTFIEAVGLHAVELGHRLAVLTIDPSSVVTGGSVLGDKTRMTSLSQDARAFIRPSPSGGALGGVAARSREVMLVCEAAGYDLVLIESVGVGQSEITISHLVDCFLMLLIPSAGDELQGIKRGILEVVDMLAVNKADGDLEAAALRAQQDYGAALRILRGHRCPSVHLVSALSGRGIPELFSAVEAFLEARVSSGALYHRRREQALRWMWAIIDERLLEGFRSHPAVVAARVPTEAELDAALITPEIAARRLLQLFATESDTGGGVGAKT